MSPKAAFRVRIPMSDERAEVRSLPAQGEWTYEDYCRLPDDGWRYEVLRGVLHVTPAPSWKHQRAVLRLGVLAENFLGTEPLGAVCVSPLDVILPGRLADPVQPDLVFISRERLGIVKDRLVEGAPDLIIEVLSPSNWLDDRRDKFEIYAEAGVREYWIASPMERTVEVFVLRNGIYELLGKFGEGEHVRSEVLPSFTPAINEIFVD
jgi:Uma2 family endonuclease